MACSGCNTCNVSCNTCNATCDTCNATCNTCNVICEDRQSFCPTKQTITSHCNDAFNFSIIPIAKVTQIGPNKPNEHKYFDQSVWNELAAWISKRTSIGDPSTGKVGGTYINGTTKPIFYADDFNTIAEIVYGDSDHNVNKDDLITANLFTNLVAQARIANLIDQDACDNCNTSCNGCNTCNGGCNSCDGCNTCNGGCNSCNNGCSSCNYCLSCEGHTPPPESSS